VRNRIVRPGFMICFFHRGGIANSCNEGGKNPSGLNITDGILETKVHWGRRKYRGEKR